ncbi:MAG: replicative DNA helicase [Candidatus Omnitrophica bacterium]|nr:replicative DNA helicase [Candidatus Omnitrophota bacterium]
MQQVDTELRTERLPPQDVEAETSVLGSMLIDEEAIRRAIELLSPSSFYRKEHAKIFQAVVRLFDSERAVDLVTLTDQLRKEGSLEEVGGASFLAELSTAVPTAANVGHYIRIVKEKYLLRSLIQAATGIVTDSFDPTREVDGVLDQAEQTILAISEKRIEGRFVPFKEVVKESIEMIERVYQKQEAVTGLATGYIDLDAMTSGFHPSDLIVVAGRPSMGKSAFIACLAEHVGVIERRPVAIFSLEMSKEQLVQRMLCSHARVDAHKVRTGWLSQTDWTRLTGAAGRLSEAPIFIDDTPGISALELKAKARRLKVQEKIELIVVDYLQLMRGTGNVENRQQEISDISRGLKSLARELSVPLIAVSQLSRAVESRSDRRPQLSDLRESGAIEQDADVVILLLREEYYSPTEENKGLAEVIIGKQRNGPVGSLTLSFVKEYTRFENVSLREGPPTASQPV